MMKDIPKKDQKITESTVIGKYGWTKGLVAKFLKNPELVPNPMYRSAPPMKLYKVTDVERIMKGKRFAEEFAKASKRKKSAAKAVNTKAKYTMERVRELIGEISVNVVENVRKLAVESHNEFEEYKEMNRSNYIARFADVKSVPKNVLDRWAVNYVRHEQTVYDEDLYDLSGSVGMRDAYVEYKSAVLDAIGAAYPFLKQECDRQKAVARGEDKISDFLRVSWRR